MALVLADRVKETTIVVGTGTATLLGAVVGYQTFASAIGNSNTTYYAIVGQGTSEWEVGVGTYTLAGTTLARTTVLSSSNAGALVTFSAGTKDVFVTLPASVSVYEDTAGNISIPGIITSTVVTTGSSTNGAFNYGTLSYADVNHLATFQASVNSYAQVEVQNTNSGASASADYIVGNNLTTATTFYGSLGMNSSGWAGTLGTTSFNAPSIVYVTATSVDLVIGTTTANAIRFVTGGGADRGIIDANGNFGIGKTPSGTNLLELGAGTATKAPLAFTAGTNLTTPYAGAIEYDGTNFLVTAETTSGRNIVESYQQFRLAANGTTITGAAQNYFGANSAASLLAATTYDIECFCLFLKTTAGTAQWIPTFSSAVTLGHSDLAYTPVTGFTTTLITGALVSGEAINGTATVLTHLATAALTTAVNHIAKLNIRVVTNLACNFRLNLTQSAGTATPLAGSFYTLRKVIGTSGNFVA